MPMTINPRNILEKAQRVRAVADGQRAGSLPPELHEAIHELCALLEQPEEAPAADATT